MKYLQNKIWYRQAVKSTRTRKSYRTYKKLQFPFKNWHFSTFTTLSLHSWSSVDADFCIFFGLCDMRNKVVYLILEHSSLKGEGGLNRKNTRKNTKFWPINPYYKRSNWKTWPSESFSEALTSKLWNKKYMLPSSL